MEAVADWIDEHPVVFWALSLVVILGASAAMSIASAHYEAEAFNACTGSHATWRDAVWLDLRVEQCRASK